MMRADQVRKEVLRIADYMKAYGIRVPEELSDSLEAIKTIPFYRRAMRRAVLEFYRGDVDAFEFIDEMIRLIEGQFQRAWNEGLRELNIDPSEARPEWQGILQGRIDQELNHVLSFATAVEQAGDGDEPIQPLYSRVEMWVNRYTEIVNLAKITAGEDQKLKWRLGATEQHCSTCSGLDGIVAFASEWQSSGYQPQSAPNPRLECGGWRCDCYLQPTTDRRSRGGIPSV